MSRMDWIRSHRERSRQGSAICRTEAACIRSTGVLHDADYAKDEDYGAYLGVPGMTAAASITTLSWLKRFSPKMGNHTIGQSCMLSAYMAVEKPGSPRPNELPVARPCA
jgi:hypothetical protein